MKVVRPFAAAAMARWIWSSVARVDGGGGIVQDQDARVGQEGARQRQALALSAGEGHAALADDRLVALVESVDEVIAPGRRRPRLRSRQAWRPGLPKAMLSLTEREKRKISCSMMEIC